MMMDEDLVNKLNNDEVIRLTPLLTYLCLIIISGLIGNGLVCYIYKPKQILTSPRWFIFFLGALDLFSCGVIVPCELATIFYQLNFENTLFCKFSSFFNVWSTLAMVWTLIIVAIDRYRKVCKPNSWQLKLKSARIVCIVAVTAALFMALPALAGRDIHHKVHKKYNVTVSVCTFRSSGISDYKLWYVLLGMGLFLTSLFIICVMNCLIGSTIYKRSKAKSRQNTELVNQDKTLDKPEANKLLNAARQSVNFDKRDEQEVAHIDISTPNESVDSNETTEQSINMIINSNSATEEPQKSPRKLEKTMSTKARGLRAKKVSLSLFLVSVAFVICYLPNLSLLLARSTQKNFEESLTDTQRSVYMFFLRSHLLNCAVNPFIYFVSDSHFKDQCKAIWQTMVGSCKSSG